MKTVILLLLLLPFAASAVKFNSEREVIRQDKTESAEWKYVQLRRYVADLEASIKKDTQWVVFEQNNESLWARVQALVANKLLNEWRAGRLKGTTEAQAYFVICNRTTMTQANIDNGRLICQIGIAPLKPAEFTVFQLQHNTATSPVE